MTTKNDTPTIPHGPGLCSMLTVLFVGLKLTDHIDWSWWWVFSPVLGAIVFALFLTVIYITLLLMVD